MQARIYKACIPTVIEIPRTLLCLMRDRKLFIPLQQLGFASIPLKRDKLKCGNYRGTSSLDVFAKACAHSVINPLTEPKHARARPYQRGLHPRSWYVIRLFSLWWFRNIVTDVSAVRPHAS